MFSAYTWPRYQVRVYRTIGPLVIISALKHKLCIFVPTIYVLSKNKKNITLFHLKIVNFTAIRIHYIA